MDDREQVQAGWSPGRTAVMLVASVVVGPLVLGTFVTHFGDLVLLGGSVGLAWLSWAQELDWREFMRDAQTATATTRRT